MVDALGREDVLPPSLCLLSLPFFLRSLIHTHLFSISSRLCRWED